MKQLYIIRTVYTILMFWKKKRYTEMMNGTCKQESGVLFFEVQLLIHPYWIWPVGRARKSNNSDPPLWKTFGIVAGLPRESSIQQPFSRKQYTQVRISVPTTCEKRTGYREALEILVFVNTFCGDISIVLPELEDWILAPTTTTTTTTTFFRPFSQRFDVHVFVVSLPAVIP